MPVNPQAAPVTLFNRAAIAARRARALAALAANPQARDPFFLHSLAAEDITERLSLVLRQLTLTVDYGSPDSRLADALLKVPTVGSVIRLAPPHGKAGPHGLAAMADEELMPLAHESVDCIASTLTLQAVNDLPGALIQMRRALKPDGLLIGTLIGGETLKELRAVLLEADAEQGGAAMRVAPFTDVRDFGALLQRAGFALPVADSDRLTVRYDSLFALLADLRAMGATSPLKAPIRPLSRRTLMRAASLYQERYSDPDGRIRATVELVSFSGWAPHESQQKPLAPGSARMRLADALGTTERDFQKKK